jgi:hypothetical protein
MRLAGASIHFEDLFSYHFRFSLNLGWLHTQGVVYFGTPGKKWQEAFLYLHMTIWI